MIRYVHIGDQINDDANEFALYDTVVDRFLTFAGSQTWESWRDLEEDMTCERRMPGGQPNDKAMRERLHTLCQHHGLASRTIRFFGPVRPGPEPTNR